MKKLLTLLILLITVFLVSCSTSETSTLNEKYYKIHYDWLEEAVSYVGFEEYLYDFDALAGSKIGCFKLDIYGVDVDGVEKYCRFICYVEDDNEPEVVLLEEKVLE